MAAWGWRRSTGRGRRGRGGNEVSQSHRRAEILRRPGVRPLHTRSAVGRRNLFVRPARVHDGLDAELVNYAGIPGGSRHGASQGEEGGSGERGRPELNAAGKITRVPEEGRGTGGSPVVDLLHLQDPVVVEEALLVARHPTEAGERSREEVRGRGVPEALGLPHLVWRAKW